LEGEEFGHGSRHDGGDGGGDRNFGKFPDRQSTATNCSGDNRRHSKLIVMQDDKVFVSLTHEPLEPIKMMDLVRSHEAGAIVLFAGTTRNNFAGNHQATLKLTPKTRK
jgi:hypothetical protein